VDVKELRDCNNERLQELEKTLRRQLFDARIKNFTNQLDDTASIRRARKDLARVKTILNERVGTFSVAAPDGAAGAEAAEIEETE
jgi:large subunit ribosomal protein L29